MTPLLALNFTSHLNLRILETPLRPTLDTPLIVIIYHQCAAVVSCGWAKVQHMPPSSNRPKLAYIVQSSDRSCLSMCPCRSFNFPWLLCLVVFSSRSPPPLLWSERGDTRGPSVAFEAVDVPCPGPLHGCVRA